MSSSHKREINILLLGETGVGKSTFINAFANYLNYETMKEAANGNIICLIPTQFTMTDENFEEKTIRWDESDNECFLTGQSCTQSCRTYVFPFGKTNIRLIDTPGVGDIRGVEKDKINFEHILSFIAEYDQLHLICILLKPDMQKLTASFQYCLKQLLCHLQKEASKNMVFLFTNSRQTFYRPKGTLPLLRHVLQVFKNNPPHVDIPLNKKTMYCLDNDSFQFLIALKNKINFPENEIKDYSGSWETSVRECQRLIQYILTGNGGHPLEPHLTQNMLSINETRRLIITLGKPIADITKMLSDSMAQINNLKNYMGSEENIRTLLKKVKTSDYQQLEWVYFVPVFGWLKIARNAKNAQEQARIRTKELLDLLEKARQDKNNREQLLSDLTKQSQELAFEMSFIVKAQAKFALFLKNNAIATYNDNYKQYVEEQIESLKKGYNENKDETIKKLKDTIVEYEREFSILENAIKGSDERGDISLKAINKLIVDLYGLNYFGKEIKVLHEQSKIERSGKIRVEKEHVANPSTTQRFMRGIRTAISYFTSSK